MVKIGKKVEENNGTFPVYKGLVRVTVEAINPNSQKIHEIRGYEPQSEPQYVSTDRNGKPQVRLDFYVKASSMDLKTTFRSKFAIFLTKDKIVGATSGKTKIIDKYGRTAWATPTDLANKAIPVYSNGPADIDAMYRPAYVGEEELCSLLRAWLNIPVPSRMADDGGRVPTDAFMSDPTDCETSLDMNKLFSGDFSELQGLIEAAGDFEFKAAAGGQMYNGSWRQDILNRAFTKMRSQSYKALEEAVADANTRGAGERLYSAGTLEKLPEIVVSPTSTEEVDSISDYQDSTSSDDDDLPF